jgi:transcriptional activator of cad operon
LRETIYRFGDFELSCRERILRRQGTLVPMPPKAVATLLVLLEADGRVVSKAELLDAVWPGTFVDEANLPQTMSVLRRALEPGFPDTSPIETVSRVGYMFRAPINIDSEAEQPPVSSEPEVREQTLPDGPAQPIQKTAREPAERPNRTAWLVTAVAIAVFLAGAVFWFSNRHAQFLSGDLKLVPLTSGAGWELDPTISPDGKLLAYSSRRSGEASYSLWVKPVFGLEGAKCILRQENNVLYPKWSPDGSKIAFISMGGHEPSGVSVLNVATGEARVVKSLPLILIAQTPLGDGGNMVPAWLPDGHSLVYSQWNGKDRTFLLLLDTLSGKTETLTEPPSLTVDDQAAVSPDGRSVAFLREGENDTDIDLIDLKTRKITSVQSHWTESSGLAWDPRGRELVTASAHAGTAWTMWRVPLNGEPTPVNTGAPAMVDEPVFSRDGKIFAFTSFDPSTDLQLVPELTGTATPRVLYPATQGATEGAVSWDGKQIAFGSNRSGQFEVWLGPLDGDASAQPTQLTHGLNVQNAWSVQWSPDDQTLTLAVVSKSNVRCIVVDTRTGGIAPVQVPGQEQFACWEPIFSLDGRWIYVYLSKDTGPHEYKVSVGAVPYAEALPDILDMARFYEGYPWQYTTGDKGIGLFRSKQTGPDASKLEAVPGLQDVHFSHNWTQRGGGVLFMDTRKPNPPLERYDVLSGKITALTAPLEHPDFTRDFDYRSREHYLIYTRFRESAGTQIYALVPRNQ